MASNDIFVHLFTFVHGLQKDAFIMGVAYLSRAKYELAVPHGLMSSPETCIGQQLYRYLEMENVLYLD